MKKKPSKRSTGKANPSARRDPQLMIEFHKRDKPRPPQPPPTRQEIKARRERIARRLARDEARRQEFLARLARPPADMQRDRYRLPDDVASFLRRLHKTPTFDFDEQHIGVVHIGVDEKVEELVEAAYMEGCRQGFIEGFLYGEEKTLPGASKNRERLRRQNLEKLARLGIDERNAEIVAEFHRLEHEMPGKDDRYKHLAETAKRDKRRSDWPTTDRQIGAIVRGFGKPRR